MSIKWKLDWKPCPICGEGIETKNATEVPGEAKPNEYWIDCPKCGLETPLIRGLDELNKYWNTRYGDNNE